MVALRTRVIRTPCIGKHEHYYKHVRKNLIIAKDRFYFLGVYLNNAPKKQWKKNKKNHPLALITLITKHDIKILVTSCRILMTYQCHKHCLTVSELVLAVDFPRNRDTL